MLTFNTTTRLNGPWHAQAGSADDLSSYAVDPDYLPTSAADINPFSINGNNDLVISSFNAPADVDPSLIGNRQNVAGMLTTQGTFAQTYGYFEMTAELPTTPGIQTAFWMLPANGGWPPELDVFEISSTLPDVMVMTAHGNRAGPAGTAIVPASTGFHTYAVDWTPTNITWYFDGKVEYQTMTPSNMNTPMYMIATTMTEAADTVDPGPNGIYRDQMIIQSVHAWDSNPYVSGSIAQPDDTFNSGDPDTVATGNTNPLGLTSDLSAITADQIGTSPLAGMAFIYATDDHNDTIADFNPAKDVIDFTNTVQSFGSILMWSSPVDGHAVVQSDHNTIDLTGVSISQLTASNIVFNQILPPTV